MGLKGRQLGLKRIFPPVNVENTNNGEPIRWFALRVKSQSERTVAVAVRNKGFEEFLPLYRHRNRWSDRIKLVELPLFPGYLFCRIDPSSRLPILKIPGALHFVGIGRTPVPIDDAEIAAIQAAVRSGLPTQPAAYLEVGERVRPYDGPLAGLEGILVEARDQYSLVVSVTLLRRSLMVEIDRDWVTPPITKPVQACIGAIAT